MPPDCDTLDPAGRIRLRGIKGRNVFRQMLNSSSIRHTVNMKLLLLAFVICFSAVLAAPADKQKREILPGDPRYGTDNHSHHHHHHEHENEVPKPNYGPPNHKPGNLINGDHYVSGDNIKGSVQVPSTSYGSPDTTQLTNNYLGPATEDKTTLLKVTVPKTDVYHKTDVNIDYQAPSAEAPITSYGLPDVKTISEYPNYDTVHAQKSGIVVPQVKVTKLPETQVFNQQSISSLPSFTSFNTGSSLLSSAYPSYPTGYSSNYHQSLSSIPVKTIDHHVQVQVPQPYPVPVTKQVTYRVPVPHAVEVPKPYHVRVPYPVQYPVDRPYPVEVPRAVPYPVPHYVHTNVPVIQPQLQHHVINTVKANPIQTFFENTASTFQDAISNLPSLPSFTNPLQNFPNLLENFPNFPSNPFENFQLPSLTPAQPSSPSLTSAQPSSPTPTDIGSIVLPNGNDAVTVDNPTVETTFTKTSVITPIQTIEPVEKATTQKEYVQPTDVNGGYVY